MSPRNYHPCVCDNYFDTHQHCPWNTFRNSKHITDFKCDNCAASKDLCRWPDNPTRRHCNSLPPAIINKPPKPVFRKTPAPSKPPTHSTSLDPRAPSVTLIEEESISPHPISPQMVLDMLFSDLQPPSQINVDRFTEQYGEEAEDFWFARKTTFEEQIKMVGRMASKITPDHPTVILTQRMIAVLRLAVETKFKDLVAETLLSISKRSNSDENSATSSSSCDKGKKRALNQD
ncbi:hypothetical protein DFH28DRAFT_1081351 [Melampsora americana]|nr:hypothetical protein DFH28DRAFT_1081351 [Melampsora americana]